MYQYILHCTVRYTYLLDPLCIFQILSFALLQYSCFRSDVAALPLSDAHGYFRKSWIDLLSWWPADNGQNAECLLKWLLVTKKWCHIKGWPIDGPSPRSQFWKSQTTDTQNTHQCTTHARQVKQGTAGVLLKETGLMRRLFFWAMAASQGKDMYPRVQLLFPDRLRASQFTQTLCTYHHRHDAAQQAQWINVELWQTQMKLCCLSVEDNGSVLPGRKQCLSVKHRRTEAQTAFSFKAELIKTNRFSSGGVPVGPIPRHLLV